LCTACTLANAFLVEEDCKLPNPYFFSLVHETHIIYLEGDAQNLRLG
jgi:hypothetical protein